MGIYSDSIYIASSSWYTSCELWLYVVSEWVYQNETHKSQNTSWSTHMQNDQKKSKKYFKRQINTLCRLLNCNGILLADHLSLKRFFEFILFFVVLLTTRRIYQMGKFLLFSLYLNFWNLSPNVLLFSIHNPYGPIEFGCISQNIFCFYMH